MLTVTGLLQPGLRDAACGRPPSRYSRRVAPDVLR